MIMCDPRLICAHYTSFDTLGGSWVNRVLFEEQIVYLETAWQI